MDKTFLLRLGAVLFVGFAVTTMAIDHMRPDEAPLAPVVVIPHYPNAELRRCQLLGEDALRDTACAKTWAQSRDRFIKRIPVPVAGQASGATATGAR